MILVDGYKLNDYAVEALVELRNSQPVKDRMNYISVAVESIVKPETRVKLIQKLYDDIISHTPQADTFGSIPDSKGDLTKYKHYKIITSMFDKLSKMRGADEIAEIKMSEDLFNMIISCRSDFEYGYKFDIELIKLSYCTLVVALHRMIDICMMKYIDKMKQISGITFQVPPSKIDNLLVVTTVRDILKLYNKGEWTEMINSFKKGRNNWLGTVGAAAKALGLITAGGAVTTTGAALLGILALLSTVLLIRKLIYLFYSSAYKINDAVSRSKVFLEYALNQEQDVNAAIAQQHILNSLNKIHDVIETKIFADDEKAKKNITKVNKDRFSISDINTDNLDKVHFNEEPVSNISTGNTDLFTKTQDSIKEESEKENSNISVSFF